MLASTRKRSVAGCTTLTGKAVGNLWAPSIQLELLGDDKLARELNELLILTGAVKIPKGGSPDENSSPPGLPSGKRNEPPEAPLGSPPLDSELAARLERAVEQLGMHIETMRDDLLGLERAHRMLFRVDRRRRETMSEPGSLTEPPQVIDPKRLFQLRISLRDVRPSVWRSVMVSPETTFGTLHDVIQAAMGWENFHLHRFGWTARMGGSFIADSYWENYADDEGRTYPLGSTPIGAIHFRVGDSFIYEYDMGDQWVHDVRVEKKPEKKGRPAPSVGIGRQGGVPAGGLGRTIHLPRASQAGARVGGR